MMIHKFLFLFSALVLISCNHQAPSGSSGSSAGNDYATQLKEKETHYMEKGPAMQGKLISTILFELKTTEKEFEDGLIPWVDLKNPEDHIKDLKDAKQVVISETKITIIIDYPLTNEYRFEVESKDGFTRELLLQEISKAYSRLYEEEEKSATQKTIPLDKRKGLINRNETNGKYGIWGHDIADLALSEIYVYKTTNGQLILSLGIES